MAVDGLKPKILLIPCSLGGESEDLLSGITNCDLKYLASNSREYEHFTEYDWTINNKYYTAELTLLLVKDPKPPPNIKEIIGGFEAVVISFDVCDDRSFASAREWVRILDVKDIEIKVLFSKGSKESKELETSKEHVDSWCVKNSFEFVDSVQNDDGEFSDKIGFDRVREILDTHLWPNMKRKPKEFLKSSVKSQEEDNNLAKSNDNETDEAILNGDETQLESFEALFGKMHDMKLHAQSLPDDQRKEYAERVTLAFWKAMGFDEDEITGL